MQNDVQRLDSEVESILFRNPQVQARRLKIGLDSHRLVLEGQVESYFQKQMAQESIRGVVGDHVIDNRLAVVCT